MERLISVSVFKCFLQCQSEDYIDDYITFKIECKKLSEEKGFFCDRYKLSVKGEEEDIQMFEAYLRSLRFKIKFIE